MKKIMIAALFMTCSTPQPLLKSNSSPNKDQVFNKIKIKGDSNHVEINYYWYKNVADTLRRDTL